MYSKWICSLNVMYKRQNVILGEIRGVTNQKLLYVRNIILFSGIIREFETTIHIMRFLMAFLVSREVSCKYPGCPKIQSIGTFQSIQNFRTLNEIHHNNSLKPIHNCNCYFLCMFIWVYLSATAISNHMVFWPVVVLMVPSEICVVLQ